MNTKISESKSALTSENEDIEENDTISNSKLPNKLCHYIIYYLVIRG